MMFKFTPENNCTEIILHVFWSQYSTPKNDINIQL